MERFFNALKGQAGALDQSVGQPRFGLVTSVDPGSATARVQLQPEGILTGWLPLLSAWVGAGWGMTCPPSPGDQVLVLPQEGDAEHGIIVGAAFSDVQRPPPAPAGELWLTHQSGSFLKLTNDGTVQIQGDLHVNGGSLDRLRQHYDAHSHAGGPGPTPTD